MKKDIWQLESDRAGLLAEAHELCERAVKADLVMKWYALRDYAKKKQSEVENLKHKLKEMLFEASFLRYWCKKIPRLSVKSE